MSGSVGTFGTPNLQQIVQALQQLVQISGASEQQLQKIVAALGSGTLSGPIASSATAGTATLPANPDGFAFVTITGTVYKVALYKD